MLNTSHAENLGLDIFSFQNTEEILNQASAFWIDCYLHLTKMQIRRTKTHYNVTLKQIRFV